MAGKGKVSRAAQVESGAWRPLPPLVTAAVLLFVWCALAAGCISEPRAGSVSVTSLPPGAAVYLDEDYLGTAPLEIANLTPGTYLVRLRMEGYGDREVAIVVEAGNRTSVTASYPPLPTSTPTPTPVVTTVPTTPPFPFLTTTPAPGALSLTSFPTGATVSVNGIRMGTTPLVIRNLTPGTYHVRYSLVGWDDSDSVLSVSSGQTMTDYVTLRQ